jgi:hypothetical protein
MGVAFCVGRQQFQADGGGAHTHAPTWAVNGPVVVNREHAN